MNKSTETCPICGEGQLTDSVVKNTVEYKGQTTDLDMHFSVCNFCGSEQANKIQLRDNKRAMNAFKKKVDGLLPGEEVRRIRRRLHISQVEAARVFGGGPVAFSKYESDDVAQSDAMDKLLRLALDIPDAYEYLLKKAGIQSETQPEWFSYSIELTSQKTNRPSLRVIAEHQPESDSVWRKTA